MCTCTCAEPGSCSDRQVLALLMLLAGQVTRAPIVDERSGLLAYDAWQARAAPALRRHRHVDEHRGLLIVDIDRFKNVNDSAGHLAGDAVVAALAQVIREQAHGHDLVGRFGGDEFVVFLDHLRDPRSALDVAERIRAAAEGLAVEVDTPDGTRTITGVSVSVGAVVTDRVPVTLTQLLWAADAALYDAKHAGRNTVRVTSATPAAADVRRAA